MTPLTLLRQDSPLAKAENQRRHLEDDSQVSIPAFQSVLKDNNLHPLFTSTLQVLQINVGKLCNQTCQHCHVDAGPDRRELMSKETFEHCLRLLAESDIETVDITGGAPEMNPHFEWFVSEVRKLNRHVIDRCNLTILTAPGFTHLPEFLASHGVEVIASLPCYLEENCDRQRGDGVFARSISALKLLNNLGYAMPNSGLRLSLVYNPVGPTLPPDQQKLQDGYRDQLRHRFGIEFDNLYTITNMPISRFLDDLLQTGRYEEYMSLLVNAFNPGSVASLMCRTTISVDWLGNLYNCDFNQMLEMPILPEGKTHIRDVRASELTDREIAVGRHCFGCTAGAGSSCTGSLVH